MHKKILALLVALFCVPSVFSQDIIHLKSGQDVEAKIIEMDGEKIRYKKFNYQDGMDLILSLSKVASITYGNGETENFDVPEPAPAIQTIPAPTNSEQTSVEQSAPASEVTAPVEQATTTEQTAPETVPVAEPKPNEVAPAAVAAPASVVQQVTGPSPADANAVPQKPLYYENSAGNEYVVVKKRKKIPPMENPESVWYKAPNNGFSIWFQPLGLVMWGSVVGFSVRHKTAFMIDGYVRLPQFGFAYQKASDDPDEMTGVAFGFEAKTIFATRNGGWLVGTVFDIGVTRAIYDKGMYDESENEWWTFVVGFSGAYRFCFGRHFHMDLGLEMGILYEPDEDWRHSNPEHAYYSPSYDRTDDGLIALFGQFVFSIGVEF